ncbi:class I SAM-dependent methyltransferase [Gymnodinialimonas ceratoperidinii]|uniref:Class I SAM-dependent methyltransferase n=1 Tax=Gymnodinialimonas ceratoperidinii TaxID=2856823 RepID=A0A8F6TW75_9RHOB|nr:class I SAM-dependent methyltransferase [Gymnodinialimonas ceratoperidinii]QXT39044.1 class I SAM-dependent methyltransferase [Gymnodinialimonas ceratoperidinii]
MGVARDHLNALYAETSDPWGFAHSTYEQGKFAATRDALSRRRYASAFELGCGNGQLARHLVGMCDSYTGMDAVETALEAARETVPTARFVQGYYPCPLPEGDYDLLILSEILYFLDPDSLTRLAKEVAASWPRAEVLCVSWLGETENPLQGAQALELFKEALPSHVFERVEATDRYCIDRALPRRRA